jgi:hypothetical protein
MFTLLERLEPVVPGGTSTINSVQHSNIIKSEPVDVDVDVQSNAKNDRFPGKCNNKTTMALAREIWDPNNKKSLNRSNVNSTIGLPIANSTFSSDDNDWV